MDPDIPLPSVEPDPQTFQPDSQSLQTQTTSRPQTTHPLAPAGNLRHSSPLRSPHRGSLPQNPHSPPRQHSPSPSRASANQYGERTVLNRKTSTGNLTVARSSTPSKLQYRRSSSNLNPSTPAAVGKSSPDHSVERSPPMTPASVASDFFKKELESHPHIQSEVIVIVHDSCYGHRFSRPKATKGALSTIVERPERIHAALLGVSTAYVRIGGRHVKGGHAPHPEKTPGANTDFPFRIHKTSRKIQLNHPAVTHVHGAKWMDELQIMCDSAESKLAMNGKELSRPIGYGKDEAGNQLPKLHEGDLYLCAESLSALQGCLGGVCEAADTVFTSEKTRRAFVCIRPPGHHCSSNFPSGFCWLNNVHVGISYAAMNHGLTHAAIIDFDLHHGDGSQTIAWDHNRKAQNIAKNAGLQKKTAIGYFSLHDINSYPCEWGDEEKVRNASLCIENAHGQSIWNVHLEPWKDLREFWRLYETRYKILLEKTRVFLRHHTARIRATGQAKPEAVIFLSAGFDASQWEGAGMQRHNVNVPTEFYAQFTSDVVKMAAEPDLGVNGRVISVLEGGYSDRALTSGALSHISGLAGYGCLSKQIQHETSGPVPTETEDVSTWWTPENLQSLEDMVSGKTQIQPAKATQDKAASSYSSPTHASTAKMNEIARERRSLSAQLDARLNLLSRPPTPPPDVDWITASYELSRLIIPNDRQTLSCTHEELNKDVARSKKDRQSAVGLPESLDAKMQLRGRKPRDPASTVDKLRTASRTSNRRTTIAAVSELPDPTFGQSDDTSNLRDRPRRRSSASSALSAFQDMTIGGFGAPKPRAGMLVEQRPTTARLSSAQPDQVNKTSNVKKSRATTTTKPATKTRSSPRKPAASGTTVRQSSSRSSTVEPGAQSSSPIDTSSPLQPLQLDAAQIVSGNGDDLDSITNGMKKISIKLNLPTEKEHAAGTKKSSESDKIKKPRVVKKAPVTKQEPSKPSVAMASRSNATSTMAKIGGKVPSTSSRPGVHEAPPQLQGSGMGEDLTMARLPSLSHVPTIDMIDAPETNDSNHVSPQVVSDINIESVNEPNQSSTTSMPPPPSPIKFGQPNLIYPSTTHNRPASAERNQNSAQARNKLPVFTSSSPIPFAKSNAAGVNNVANEQQQQPDSMAIWDVPGTPQR